MEETKKNPTFHGSAANRFYVDKYTARIERVDVYLVNVICSDGRVFERLEPRRLFPVSDLDNYITLLDEDENEVAFIRRMDEIDKESAKALNECFREFYFIPKIYAVTDVDDHAGVCNWSVKTDRGDITFRIRNVRNDIKYSPATQEIRIRDTNDNRYLVPNYLELDRRSQRLINSYL